MIRKLDRPNGLLVCDSRYIVTGSHHWVLLLLLLILKEYVPKGKREWSEFIQPNNTHGKLESHYVSVKEFLGCRWGKCNGGILKVHRRFSVCYGKMLVIWAPDKANTMWKESVCILKLERRFIIRAHIIWSKYTNHRKNICETLRSLRINVESIFS